MSQISSWKKIKRSGTFYRKLKSKYNEIVSDTSTSGSYKNHSETLEISKHENTEENTIPTEEIDGLNSNFGVHQALQLTNVDQEAEIENWLAELDSDSDGEEHYFESSLCEVEKNAKLREDIRSWAVSNNISHLSQKKLFVILNERIPNCLPQDPRTLLKTRQTIFLTKVGVGNYWHNGLESSLRNVLQKLSDIPKSISINVNMDGLPIFKSSKNEFWPILYNIHEIPTVRPMIIGIYYGMGKPADLTAYLQPFVEEANILLNEGIIINGVKISFKIRSFICDSPARAFIKGNNYCF